ncbi:thiol-disulfide oxidoreductase DCC family protein [Edaphobacter modestus]|uniref:Putative DCC family thiol-disulfide oxidoreductase YuxK n=1 Tax=Edaphobacter modestus TaxID=388466 RepID=A0A4Q7YUU8_9BACT|nr:DCC1-like thiol-disulfide oxidoreductase family protein [Edaphobacter modestus]RZU41410.1 putative DCC family thiol-disulfide oxidoreductase YuxK [Edaphobacter modestus]
MTAEQRAELTGRPVLLYDGHCGMCNGLVQFCAKRDFERRMRYVPLQSELGRELLTRYGETPESLESIAIFPEALTRQEQFFHHSDAVAWALRQLRAPWNWVGRMVRWTPRFLREAVYAGIGRIRYAVFGRYPVCPIPGPEIRAQFVGVTDAGCVKA